MPRITTVDVSNHDEANEAANYFTNKGTFESHWPPKHRVSVSAPEGMSVAPAGDLSLPAKSAPKADHVAYAVQQLGVSQGDAEAMTLRDLIAQERPGEAEEDREGEETSAGTSSSTSGSKPAKTGSSAQETEPSTPSPAQDAGNLSAKGQATKPARSSSAPSTAGSSRGTGASQQSQSRSSAAKQETQATVQDGDDPK